VKEAAARGFRFALLTIALVACDLSPRPDAAGRYRQWLASGHGDEVTSYTTYLREAGLGDVIAVPDLLRSGRRWRRCRAEEFSVPPRIQWSAMKPTLRLVAELRSAGLLKGARVASVWRSREFNDSEGGSARSRHLENNALDFDVSGGIDMAGLCAYWHRHGSANRFGLGFYSPTAIHVDTSGFRTWGHDHHRGTSLCERLPAGTTSH